ncbi:MAG: GH39 family glycosyl hydrolase [Phycisphaerae bacterium]
MPPLQKLLPATLLLSLAATTAPSTQPTPPRQITLHASAPQSPLNHAFNFSVGSDRALILLRPDLQRDLRFLQQNCGFRYMRFHGLLNEEMHLVQTSPTGELTYNWTNLDQLYDFLLSLHIKPIVELGFMPEPLASGKQTVFWWKGNVTAPKSYDQWSQFIHDLTQHLTTRYGHDEVRSWFFEVWNEPNLDGFWPAGKNPYFQLYQASANAIKKIDPAYKVGGPATAGCAWIKDTLDFCNQTHTPIDFISTHTYGTMEGFLDEKGKGHTTLDPSPTSVIQDLPPVLQTIHNSPFPNLPLLITEWGPSYSPRDPIHDSYIAAPWILERLRRLPTGVTAMSYWAFSDNFEEPGPPNQPFHGGFGLLTSDGLPKPAFFAYQFLNHLGPTELHSNDPNAFACTDNHNNFQLLFWDYHQPTQDAPDNPFYTRDLPAQPLPPAHLPLTHFPPGTYTLQTTRVGYHHNDLYDAYLSLHSPKGRPDHPQLLPKEILEKLRPLCNGTPETRQITIAPNTPFALDLPMNENNVYFLTLSP